MTPVGASNGVAGTTPTDKLQGGAEGQVVKKKKGRFNIISTKAPANGADGPAQEGQPSVALFKKKGRFNVLVEKGAQGPADCASAPPQAGIAEVSSSAQSVPMEVVTNRERTLSNGSVMSQMTLPVLNRPQTIDGTGAPVVKKKGRFVVSNLKNPGNAPGQPVVQVAMPMVMGQEATMPAANLQLVAKTLSPIAGSPSHNLHHHQRTGSAESVSGSVTGGQPMNPSDALPQQQQQGPAEGIIQPPLQPTQLLIQDSTGVYPVQMVQHAPPPQQQFYQNSPVYDVSFSQQLAGQQMLQGGADQMIPQHLLYSSQVFTPNINDGGQQMQSVPNLQQQQQQQQQQYSFQHQLVPPSTPPPSVVLVSTENCNQGATPIGEGVANVLNTSVNNPPPLKQAVEDSPSLPANKTIKSQKQQQAGGAPAIGQPPRNKQRNLVAPRNGTGYGNGADVGNGTGLGKVFYFLDQMKTEVTDADRTIKTLQRDMKIMVS